MCLPSEAVPGVSSGLVVCLTGQEYMSDCAKLPVLQKCLPSRVQVKNVTLAKCLPSRVVRIVSLSLLIGLGGQECVPNCTKLPALQKVLPSSVHSKCDFSNVSTIRSCSRRVLKASSKLGKSRIRAKMRLITDFHKVPALKSPSENACLAKCLPSIAVPIMSLRLAVSLKSQECMLDCAKLPVS
jgi:hypothetical protein